MSARLELFSSLADQLLVTIGYGGAKVALEIIDHIVDTGVMKMVIVVGLLAFFGSMLQQNRPLQTMIMVIASKSITQGLPLAEEPTGVLIIPTAVLYFASCGTFIWVCYRIADLHTTDKFWLSFVNDLRPFITAFAAVRGTKFFVDGGQGNIMLYAACCYIVLAPQSDVQQSHSWESCLVKILDSFACRGLISAFNNYGPVGTAASGLQTTAVYCLVLLTMDMFKVGTLLKRVQFCKDTFSFSIAQELLSFSKTYTSHTIFLFGGIFFILLYGHSTVGYRNLRTICVGGLSLASASTIEEWISEIGCQLEKLVLYGAIFVVLQLWIDVQELHRKKNAEQIAMISAGMEHSADS